MPYQRSFYLSTLIAACLLVNSGDVVNSDTSLTTVVDFDSGATAWRSVDDSVMGGVSASRMRIDGDVAVFEGELSLENNGGFASVRSGPLRTDLTGSAGVRVRVLGDGNKYQLRIRTDGAFDGPSYQITFHTKAEKWMEVDLPYSEFIAAFRGRRIPGHPPIDPSIERSMNENIDEIN